ncbi:uncharacterized protein LOC106129060 [Amyelois transitella]|uniref:uncharacterized protein LOC106129060 n=1 Tax=Amyelois transitella TaxID=680683 RepID=UPI0029900391|nr:uncharacterized protein LOC106129060 [Amyelois transitella]
MTIMHDESTEISLRTWKRNVDSIDKIGYMDGASDGQTASFQSSFDFGYAQGFSFGFKLGLHKAESFQIKTSNGAILNDQRQINCQICHNSSTLQQPVVNLYNIQKEKNEEVVKEIKI